MPGDSFFFLFSSCVVLMPLWGVAGPCGRVADQGLWRGGMIQSARGPARMNGDQAAGRGLSGRFAKAFAGGGPLSKPKALFRPLVDDSDRDAREWIDTSAEALAPLSAQRQPRPLARWRGAIPFKRRPLAQALAPALTVGLGDAARLGKRGRRPLGGRGPLAWPP